MRNDSVISSLNFNQWFKRRCRLKDFYLELWWPFCSAEFNFGRGHYEDQFCEIISKLGQWYRRRCLLNFFLSGALAALMFSGAEPFMQFRKRASWKTFM